MNLNFFRRFKPTVIATVSQGKDHRWHVAYRDRWNNLLAESPPRGFRDADAAEEITEYLNDAKIVATIKED